MQFTENFNWEEGGSQQLWKVSFTLRECLSNPERAEAREPLKEPIEQGVKSSAADSTQHDVLLQNAEVLK